MLYQGEETMKLWKLFLSNKSIQTNKDYTIAFKKFDNYLMHDVHSSTLKECRQFIQTLEPSGLSYSTAYKNYSILSSFFQFLIQHNYIQHNHFSSIIFTPPSQTIEKIISKTELRTLLEYLEQYDPLCLTAVLLTLKTLFTTSEICSIQIRNIDLEQRFIYLKTKYKKICNSLSKDMIEPLQQYMMTLPGDAVFLYPKKKNTQLPVTTRTLLYHLEHACEAAGIQRYTYNDLRNTGITVSITGGASEDIITEAVDMKTSQHSSRLTNLDGVKRRVPNKIAEYINI